MPATAVPAARDARRSFTSAGTTRPGATPIRPTQRGTAPPAATGRSPNGGRPPHSGRGKPGQRGAPRPPGGASQKGDEREHDILFQKFFKSVGPRTYAAQVKRASNGNHYLVFMEGKRDEASGEIRKTRLFVYSEDFVEFFRLAKSAAEFIKANPVPPDVVAKREKFWARQAAGAKPVSAAPAPVPPRASGAPASAARRLELEAQGHPRSKDLTQAPHVGL